MLDIKELHDQSIGELQILAASLAREIFELKNELSSARKLERPHQIKEKRRDRARVLTVLSQKGREDGK